MTRARLAGVTELGLSGTRGPKTAFLFDPHRLALPCWYSIVQTRSAFLVTLDRHFDLVPPPLALPLPTSLHAVDDLARWGLDVRNVDHILAAMDLGVIGDALLLARSSPRGALPADQTLWRDSHGHEHRLWRCASVTEALPLLRQTSLLNAAEVVLDVDLDCFTSLDSADPTNILSWDLQTIRTFLHPEGAAEFWDQVLRRAVVMTMALEPLHCGGVVAMHRLFRDAAQALFVELLGADLP